MTSHDTSSFHLTADRQQHLIVLACWRKAAQELDVDRAILTEVETMLTLLEPVATRFYDLVIFTRVYACIRHHFTSASTSVQQLRRDLQFYAPWYDGINTESFFHLEPGTPGMEHINVHDEAFMPYVTSMIAWCRTTSDAVPPARYPEEIHACDRTVFRAFTIVTRLLNSQFRIYVGENASYNSLEFIRDGVIAHSLLSVQMWCMLHRHLFITIAMSAENTAVLRTLMADDLDDLEEREYILADNRYTQTSNHLSKLLLYEDRGEDCNDIYMDAVSRETITQKDVRSHAEAAYALHQLYVGQLENNGRCLRSQCAVAVSNTPLQRIYSASLVFGSAGTGDVQDTLYALSQVPENTSAQLAAYVYLTGKPANEVQLRELRKLIRVLKNLYS